MLFLKLPQPRRHGVAIGDRRGRGRIARSPLGGRAREEIIFVLFDTTNKMIENN